MPRFPPPSTWCTPVSVMSVRRAAPASRSPNASIRHIAACGPAEVCCNVARLRPVQQFIETICRPAGDAGVLGGKVRFTHRALRRTDWVTARGVHGRAIRQADLKRCRHQPVDATARRPGLQQNTVLLQRPGAAKPVEGDVERRFCPRTHQAGKAACVVDDVRLTSHAGAGHQCAFQAGARGKAGLAAVWHSSQIAPSNR